MNNTIPNLYLIAIQAAVKASADILLVYEEEFDTTIKQDGSPVTIADLRSSKIISDELEKTDIPIIGEERKNLAFESRQNWTENWCVDPLDGTKEFIKRNGEFCVNIAHVKNGLPYFGIIAEPCKGRMIFGGRDFGVYLWDYQNDTAMENVQEITQQETDTLEDEVVWIGSRSHESQDAAWVEEMSKPFTSVQKISKGSAVKFFDLVLGNAHIYPRFAPTMEWDIAAGQAILEALGGTVICNETATPLVYNKESLYNPFFVAKTAAYIKKQETFEKSL